MTDVCTLKKSNLVLPSTYYELDREEMSYVEGGLYLTNQTLNTMLALVGLFGLPSLPKVVKAMVSGICNVVQKIFAVSAVGGVFALVIGVYLGVHIYDFAKNIVEAVAYGKGIEIQLKWIFIVPYLDFQVR